MRDTEREGEGEKKRRHREGCRKSEKVKKRVGYIEI